MCGPTKSQAQTNYKLTTSRKEFLKSLKVFLGIVLWGLGLATPALVHEGLLDVRHLGPPVFAAIQCDIVCIQRR